MLQQFSKLFYGYILVLKPKSGYFGRTIHNKRVSKRVKYSTQDDEIKTHIYK